MASPQKENGYTAIANELFEALAKIRINGETRQVIDVIFRKTYGYNKKEDRISLSQFCEATNLGRNNVCRAISKAISMNIIRKRIDGVIKIFSINKDFDTWKQSKQVSKLRQSQKRELGSLNIENNHSQKRDIQKTVTKDNIQKTYASKARRSSKKKFFEDPTLMDLNQFLEWCRKSKERHIHVIAEWAEAEQPKYETKGQWNSFISRNVRPAMTLIAFNNEQLQKAYDKLQKDVVKIDRETGKKVGFITKYTLETLAKYI